MKKMYLTILTIVTVFCIIFGTVYHLGTFFGRFTTLNIPFLKIGNVKTTSFEKKFQGVKSAELDVDCLNVTVDAYNGDEVIISYSGREIYQPEITFKNGALTIGQPKVKDHKISNVESNLDISLPANVKLSHVDINADMGNLELSNITADSMNLSADMGSINCTGASAEKMAIDTDMGSANLNDLSFTDLSVSVDMGSVELNSDKSLADYSFFCTASMGAVTVNDEECVGDYKRSGDAGTITIDADMGSVAINY